MRPTSTAQTHQRAQIALGRAIKENEMTEQMTASTDDLTLPDVQPGFENQVRKAAKKRLTTTMTLTSDTCKWPFGDPAASDFHYCGQLPQNGRPYCETHNSLSYQSPRRKSS
jgi:hypothetical protein